MRVDELDVPVAVVEEDAKLRTQIAMLLGPDARPALHATLDGFQATSSASPGVVLVLGPSHATSTRLRELGRLHRSRTVGSVVVVEELTADILQQAMRAGVGDVVSLPADDHELIEAVQRAAADLDLRPVEAPPADQAPAESEGPRARVITVFAPKGGAGKSTIATNLAVLLARHGPGPVAIVDCDLQFGDVAVMLQIPPHHTIANVAEALDDYDADSLRTALQRHEPSGLLVLPAPTDPAQGDEITLAQVQRVLTLLSEFCETIVVDTPNAFNDVVLGVLEQSDDIVLVGGMDIPHIKNTKIALQTMRLLNIAQDKVTLVLNRANSKVRIDVAEVERTLALRADCLVPSDIVVPQSVNKGVPVVLDAPRSGVAKAYERLTDLLIARKHAPK